MVATVILLIEIHSQLAPLFKVLTEESLIEIAHRLMMTLRLLPEEQISCPFTGSQEEALFFHVVSPGAFCKYCTEINKAGQIPQASCP